MSNVVNLWQEGYIKHPDKRVGFRYYYSAVVSTLEAKSKIPMTPVAKQNVIGIRNHHLFKEVI